MNHLLEINHLSTSFFTYAGEVKAVSDVSFYVDEGEAIGIVGESGSGKSVTVQSVMQLIPNPPGKIVNGEIIFQGKDLAHANEKVMQAIRGKEMGMIFQDPMTSLNPVLTVGMQMTEVLKRHKGLSSADAMQRAEKYLEMVGIPNPKARLKQYPHEFSGGMRQRVMIAMALLCNPKLLIADEPTTALDVTIQAQILELMKDLKSKINTSIILITHDLGVVAGICTRVIVMYGGRVVETGTVNDILQNPKHPYTWGLLKSVPRLDSNTRTKLVPIQGTPPDLLNPPKGCSFAARCPYAMKVCLEQNPVQTKLSELHQASCWLLHSDAPKVEGYIPRKGGVTV